MFRRKWAVPASPFPNDRIRLDFSPRCSSSVRPAKTATRRCRRTRSKRAFALTNARSARAASTAFSPTSARTAAVDLFHDRFDRPGTGRAITSSARIPRAPRSSTSPSTPKLTRSSRRPSGASRRKSGRPDTYSALRLPSHSRNSSANQGAQPLVGRSWWKRW